LRSGAILPTRDRRETDEHPMDPKSGKGIRGGVVSELEDAFQVGRDHRGAYAARLSANLAAFDRIDGAIAWPLGTDGAHPRTELLLGRLPRRPADAQLGARPLGGGRRADHARPLCDGGHAGRAGVRHPWAVRAARPPA
jgi:hypothetical protein